MNEETLNINQINSGVVVDDYIRPFMSVIIPAYNCSNEIERLLNSIVIQKWSKQELEVIICDDNSTDNFMSKVQPYYEVLNIKYFITNPRDIHCPGNTRKDGLSFATGEWVTFIDNDDMFEPEAFNMIREHIQSTGESREVRTKFRESKDGEYVKEFDATTWLHGKWYNLDYLRSHNIDFKENLESHEDLYFNSLIDVEMMKEGVRASYPLVNLEDEYFVKEDGSLLRVGPNQNRKFFYNWIYRPNSLSRGYFNTEHYYIEVYLFDYLYAATDPWLQGWKYFQGKTDRDAQCREYCINQCIATVLFGYMYYQAEVYRIGEDKALPQNRAVIKDLIDQVCFRFKMTKTDIINKVYNRPDDLYDRVKQDAYKGTNKFVEVVSFRDFILGI